jgi:hypothetical protein
MARCRSFEPRELRRTLLIVGEGKAEVVWLSHLEGLFVERGSKTVTIKDAKGKGGRHVLDVAIKQHRVFGYDAVAVLLDTDTQWDDTLRSKARRHRVSVLEAEPCTGAVLLAILGAPAPGPSRDCKREFERRLGAPAHDERIYAHHFPRELLLRERCRVAVLDEVIRLLVG